MGEIPAKFGQIPAKVNQAAGQAYDFAEPGIREAGRQLVHPGTDTRSAEFRAQQYAPYPIQDYGYQTPLPVPPPGWWKQNQDMPAPEPQKPTRAVPKPAATTTLPKSSYSGFWSANHSR